MAPHRCLQLTVILTGLTASYPLLALEAMDDTALANTVGQAAGLKITQEYENRTDSIEYWDDNGWGEEGTRGNLTINNMVTKTATNRPEIRELRLKRADDNSTYLEITDIDYSTEQSYKLSINGKSLGTFGEDNYQGTYGRKTILRAGGAKDEHGAEIGGPGGVSIDWLYPAELTYDSWVEQNGVRQTHTVMYDDIYNKGEGGLANTNITVDIVDEGLRIGLQEVVNGFKGEVNNKIGNDIHGSTAMRNINYKPGGYVMIKSAKEAGDIGLELDLVLKEGSGFEQVDISGAAIDLQGTEAGKSYLTDNHYVSSTQIELQSDLRIEGMRLNVDGQHGVMLDFDKSEGAPVNVASANIEIYDHKIIKGGENMESRLSNLPSLGTTNMQLNLTNQSYIQIEGY